jgi:hypothetical protein
VGGVVFYRWPQAARRNPGSNQDRWASDRDLAAQFARTRAPLRRGFFHSRLAVSLTAHIDPAAAAGAVSFLEIRGTSHRVPGGGKEPREDVPYVLLDLSGNLW